MIAKRTGKSRRYFSPRSNQILIAQFWFKLSVLACGMKKLRNIAVYPVPGCRNRSLVAGHVVAGAYLPRGRPSRAFATHAEAESLPVPADLTRPVASSKLTLALLAATRR